MIDSKTNQPEFSSDLILLKREFNDFDSPKTFSTDNEDLILDETGDRVLVRITSNRVDELITQLQEFDFKPTEKVASLNFIEGYFPIQQLNHSLDELIAKDLLLGVTPVYQPIINGGKTTSQADFVHEVDRVRTSLPQAYNGTGVEIGVLSNSYNTKNGASADIASGDLPAAGVSVLQDLSSTSSDEGRAMLQLIYDLAPGASLSFATAFTGEKQFADNIRALANNGADIIVDDVIYFAEPFFQDGVVALAVDDVVKNKNVAYFSSAGNQAAKSYETSNFNGNSNTSLDTIANPVLKGSGSYRYHDFNPGASVDLRQQVTLNNGQNLKLALQWDDPFYTTNQVDTDLDILLINSANKVVANSVNDNIVTQVPFELLNFTNSTGSTQTYDIVIAKYAGANPSLIKYVNFGSSVTPEYFTNSSTIYGHAAARNAEAVAAVPFYNQNQPESFTALGSTRILYEYQTDASGKIINVIRKATPEIRQKPDIAAIDGTNTTFFGSDSITDADTFPNFFGTSAAAPHAAAIAVLLKQANPNLTPSQIYDRLESTATDIDSPGVDKKTGYGLINAYDAIFGSVVPAEINFSDNFEDGDLPLAYETKSTGAGRIQVTGNNSPNGSYHLTLDSSGQNIASLNEAILYLNMSGYSNVQLSFAEKEFNDNDNVMPATFTGSHNSDGVALSVDGNNWYRLVDLTGSNSTNIYQTHNINLSNFATANNLTLGANVRLKFQQYGNNPIETNGIAIDNISVKGVLAGSNLNDVLTGNNSHNTIEGYLGNDNLRGNAGNDVINGNDGHDFLEGGNGNDLLHGNSGNDQIYGNGDNDLLFGDSHNDLLKGGSGRDTLLGGDGQDRLYGESENDSLTGGNNVDTLYGGAGNDTLDGGSNSDRLFGNEGNDIFVLRQGNGSDTIYDYQDGFDRLGLAGGLTFNDLEITNNNGHTKIAVDASGEILANLYIIDVNLVKINDFDII
jgi:Ca2+-binding RTX toxin-like protein